MEVQVDNQAAAPAEMRALNLHRAKTSLIESAPFVGDHANDDNLLQTGRPLNNEVTSI